jgi:lysophospholipase L1-like esterase
VATTTLCLQCSGNHPQAPAAGAQSPLPGDDLDGATGTASDAGSGSGGPVSDAAAASGDGAAQASDMADAAPESPDGHSGEGEAGSGSYSPCPASGPCVILPLGDSITYGIQYAGAYRVELFQDALTAHQSITYVGDPSLANGPTTVGGVSFPQDNDGHSGWTIDQIASLVPAPALQTNPDIVLLMIGTNDMYSQSQPVAQAPQRLAALIDSIVGAAPKALLVVAEITPLQNSTWEAQVVTYNAAIPALVKARAAAGKHVALVDMHTGFVVGAMLSSDGVHPNMAGYNHMGDVWYAAIKDVLR